MNRSITKQQICDAISRSLVEFGYPDCTPEMIGEIYDEFKAGKRFPDLPHGIIGGMAESQMKEAYEALEGKLP